MAIERRVWAGIGLSRMDVSGYHHNAACDFLSLRPALYVSGDGQARFRQLPLPRAAVTRSE
jgi:hypothetical protein